MNCLSQRSRPPWLLKIRSSKAFILTTISMAVFTDIFLYGMIVPILPFTLTERIGIPSNQVQKYVSILLAVYGGALLAVSPICGFFADRTSSRRLPLLLGLFALTGSTLMLCLARDLTLFLIGRILQGTSAAVVWTVGLALLVDTLGKQNLGQAMGFVTLAMSIGGLISPLIGGVVFAKRGYYAVYYIAFAFLALDILFRLLMIEKKVAARFEIQETPDSFQMISMSTSANAVTGHASRSASQNENASDRRSQETRHRSFFFPVVTLLKSKRLVSALWGAVVQAIILASFDSVLPLFVKSTFSWNSTGAGLIFTPLLIPSFFEPLIGWASDRYGPRWIAGIGFILSLPFLVLLRLVTHDSMSQKILLCGVLFLVGISIGLVMPPLMAEITHIVEAKERVNPGLFGPIGAYGLAYGLLVGSFSGGTLIGPFWAGFINSQAGWGTMAWTLGLLGALTALPTLLYTGGTITKRPSTTQQRDIGVEP